MPQTLSPERMTWGLTVMKYKRFQAAAPHSSVAWARRKEDLYQYLLHMSLGKTYWKRQYNYDPLPFTHYHETPVETYQDDDLIVVDRSDIGSEREPFESLPKITERMNE